MIIASGPPTPEQIAAKEARMAAVPKSVAGLEFLKRLTPQEYSAIILAAQASLAAGNPQLSLWIDMLRVHGQVDLSGPDAPAAKAGLVAAGLLTQSRADAIFA